MLRINRGFPVPLFLEPPERAILAIQETQPAFAAYISSRAARFLSSGCLRTELANTHLDLETLWGRTAVELRERLCEASTAADSFELLQEALTDHLFRPPEHHYAVSTALARFDEQNVGTIRKIAEDVGLSERRFIEVFKSEIGVTPKLFSRLKRFQRTRMVIHKLENLPNWASVAADHGYFDQSHLIREFQEFSGQSPAAYLQEYHRFLEQHLHVKRYYAPEFSKIGQFFPIQTISAGDIISLGGSYVPK